MFTKTETGDFNQYSESYKLLYVHSSSERYINIVIVKNSYLLKIRRIFNAFNEIKVIQHTKV